MTLKHAPGIYQNSYTTDPLRYPSLSACDDGVSAVRFYPTMPVFVEGITGATWYKDREYTAWSITKLEKVASSPSWINHRLHQAEFFQPNECNCFIVLYSVYHYLTLKLTKLRCFAKYGISKLVIWLISFPVNGGLCSTVFSSVIVNRLRLEHNGRY